MPESRIAKALGRSSLGVNTLHHQTVDRLGDRARGSRGPTTARSRRSRSKARRTCSRCSGTPRCCATAPEHLALFQQLFELAVAGRWTKRPDSSSVNEVTCPYLTSIFLAQRTVG